MLHRRDRGLLDFLTALVALVGVYTGTPWGGLVDRGVAVVFNFKGPNKPLIAWFQLTTAQGTQVVPGAMLAQKALAKVEPQDENLAKVSRRDLEPSLARAFAVVASSGAVALDRDKQPWYDLHDLPHHAADRVALGLPPLKLSGTSAEDTLKERLGAGLDLLASYRKRLGGVDAALSAYAVGLPIAARAASRARLVAAQRPAAFETFAPFFTRKDGARARAFVDATRSLATAYAMRWPVEERFSVTSPFGYRMHPVLGRRMHHDGVDLGAPLGTPIHAAAAGRVLYAKSDGVNGLYVKIDHGYGLATAYCHASQLLVQQGQWVSAGTVVAKVGQTGRATGPHLHYGVFVGHKPVDPALFRPVDLQLEFQPVDEANRSPWDQAHDAIAPKHGAPSKRGPRHPSAGAAPSAPSALSAPDPAASATPASAGAPAAAAATDAARSAPAPRLNESDPAPASP